MKVLFMTNIPSPYRVDFFNELGKYCDLTVAFTDRSFKHRDDSWKNYDFVNFKGIFLRGIPLKTNRICFQIKKVIKEGNFDRIICGIYSYPTGMIAIRYMRKHKIPYFLESDGGFAKNGKGFKERVKKYFIKGAEGYFSTGKAHDEYYLAYGAEKEKIHRYPFTSLKEDDLLTSVVSEKEKSELKKQLGIKEKHCIISVGRFSYLNGYGKGYDVLLRAAREMDSNIGWYIIGGQPTQEFIDLTEKSGLTNFHYIDFKSKEELKTWYKASDVFVLMTVGEAWGLVVNEAMANGLPVITTDKCIAGLELVEDHINGYIVSVGDEKALSVAIQSVLSDKELQCSMALENITKIRKHTFEEMAKRHIEVLELR